MKKTNTHPMDNTENTVAQKLLAIAAQIDPSLRKDFIKFSNNLKDPNARAELDGIKTVLATDLSNTKLVAVIGASLRRADLQDEEAAANKKNRNVTAPGI
jgi:hypothetical protein